MYGDLKWKAGNGKCYTGMAQTVSFQFNNVAIPSDFIWGVAFNTQTAGYAPNGIPGPYDSLNVATSGGAIIGQDRMPGSAYLNSTSATEYHSAGGTGTFRYDPIGWELSGPAATFYDSTSAPEPGTIAMFALGLIGIGFIRRK